MKIIPSGPRSKTSRTEVVSVTATTPEDEEALKVLYDLLHKFEKTEILVSLAESTHLNDQIKRICLIIE